MQAYYDQNAELAASGEPVSAEALADETTSTVLSLRGGSVVASDGPFAETKELLAGFYLVDVTTKERAVEIAGLIPQGSPEEARANYLEAARLTSSDPERRYLLQRAARVQVPG